MTGPLDTSRPFTRASALAAGIDDETLRGTAYRRLLHGIHVSANTPITQLVWARAALLTVGERAFLTHQSAALLLGGVVPHSDLLHVGIVSTRVGTRSRVRVHRYRQPPPIVRWRGLRSTSPERTFLDLAEVLGLVDLVVLGDSLVRAGVTSPARLVRAAIRSRARGARLAREAAGLVRRRVDSPMETRVRLLLVLAGLPEPEVDIRLVDEQGRVVYRIDMGYRAIGLGIEYDGRHHIERERQWEHDILRREAIEGEEWRFVVLVAADVFVHPERTVRRVAQALRALGVAVASTPTGWDRYFPGRTSAASLSVSAAMEGMPSPRAGSSGRAGRSRALGRPGWSGHAGGGTGALGGRDGRAGGAGRVARAGGARVRCVWGGEAGGFHTA